MLFRESDSERLKIAREYTEKGADAYVTAEGCHIAVLDRSKLVLLDHKHKKEKNSGNKRSGYTQGARSACRTGS